MSANLVTKRTLENGLRVLIKEMHHAPVATFWVLYGVGSRNEVPGITGISHWTEHMLFKGTPTFPGELLDRAISRVGGIWNAMTQFDVTAYYETMPSNEIDLGLQIEADRMVNVLFEPDQVASERTVIISERQGSENNPTFLLAEEVRAAAFRVHPYHHDIIGDMADLETITRDDLEAHYRQFYAPNNAVVVAAGDFKTAEMLARIIELFGGIPPGPEPKPVLRTEPEQRGERRLVVEGEGETAYLQVAYRAPNATSPDYIPLVVLGSALLGGGSTGLMGGGTTNRSSRLYRALVETELASSVGGGMMPSIDPSLFSIRATVRNGSTPAQVQGALDETLTRLINSEPVTADELNQAIKRAKAAFAFGSESVTNQGFWLGFSEMIAGSHVWFQDYLRNLEQVTVEDVARVAKEYFDPRRRVVGWYVPQGS